MMYLQYSFTSLIFDQQCSQISPKWLNLYADTSGPAVNMLSFEIQSLISSPSIIIGSIYELQSNHCFFICAVI